MKAQTEATTVEYTRKDGKIFLSQILAYVKSVEVVKPVTQEERHIVSVGWKIFWVLFWVVLLWPIAIFAFFFAGERTELVWTEGQYNVTMRDGLKVILTGNEDYLVAFANNAEKKSFFN